MTKLIISNRYGTTPNDILNHKKISLKAKGLYGFLQCKPENWKFSTERIAGEIMESERTIRAVLQELEKNGLLVRRQKPRDKNGKWAGYDYILSEFISELPEPSSPIPQDGKPLRQKPVVTLCGSNVFGEDISKKEIKKKYSSKKESFPPYSPPQGGTDFSEKNIKKNSEEKRHGNMSLCSAAAGGTEKLVLVNTHDFETKTPTPGETIETKVETMDSAINKVISVFYEFDPSISFVRRGIRKASEDLISRYGVDDTIAMAKAALSFQGEPFSPVVVNPMDLRDKLGKIKVFFERNRREKERIEDKNADNLMVCEY